MNLKYKYKLTDTDVDYCVCEHLNKHKTYQELANELGVHKDTIGRRVRLKLLESVKKQHRE